MPEALSLGRIWSRRRLVIGLWLLALLLAAPFAAVQTKHLSGGGFNNLSSDSAAVAAALSRGEFRGASPDPLAVVLVPRAHAAPRDLLAAISEVTHRMRAIGGVSASGASLLGAIRSARSAPSRPVVIATRFSGGEDAAIDIATRLRSRLGISEDRAGALAGGRVEAHVAGQGALWSAFRVLADRSAKQAEARGFPIIAIVLLVVFGSVAAAVLPLSLGAVAVIIAGAVIYALSLLTEMSVFVTNIASMIGIGVAVDYSLFVLVRYREEIAAGHDREQAREIAMATSGRAVILAGCTVIVSLAALFLIPSTGIRSMATGAIVVVAVSVLAASTLLPVTIGLLGPRADQPGRVGRLLARLRRSAPTGSRRSFWDRWSTAIMRRPVIALVGAVAILLALAAPALDLKVRNSAASQLNSGNEVTEASRQAAALIGPGRLSPTWVLMSFRGAGSAGVTPGNRRAVARVAASLRRDSSIAAVDGARWSSDGRRALLGLALRYDPESQPARSAVEGLRRSLPAELGRSGSLQIGGATAELLDFDRLVTSSLWQPVLFVLAMSFLVLVVLLRSIVLPLKAMLMNALTVAASYGALVAVFQFGWLGFLGVHKSPSIYPITLPLVLVVAFGLSMDYHVFLLSRVRERYLQTGDNTKAVAEALASSATPITSAALIMIVVFLSFVGAGVPSVKQLGFAAAVAIAVDATLVRLVVVPAAMKLLGDWNWWLPPALERRLPPLPARAQAPATAEIPGLLRAPERSPSGSAAV